jgi:hypothetical protein
MLLCLCQWVGNAGLNDLYFYILGGKNYLASTECSVVTLPSPPFVD